MGSLDMSEILLEAYDLADQINSSSEVKQYLTLKHRLERDEQAQRIIREFQKVKEDFAEAERFGIFHPNYHEAKEKAEAFQKELTNHPTIRAYMEAEERLDRLFQTVSRLIAHSISKTIKVPGNPKAKVIPNKKCGAS